MSNAALWTGHGSLLSSGITAASTDGITVTPGSGSYGSYVEMFAALPVRCRAFKVCFVGSSSNGATYLRVAIGAGGSEIVVCDGFLLPAIGFQEAINSEEILIALPEGARVSVALQSNNTSSVNFFMQAIPANHLAPEGYARGYILNGPTAPLIDSGGTAHTLSAYTDQTTSLPDGVRALHWIVGKTGANTGKYIAHLECNGVEIATVFAGSRTYGTDYDRYVVIPGPFPAGSTIRSRHQASTTTASANPRVLRHSVFAYG